MADQDVPTELLPTATESIASNSVTTAHDTIDRTPTKPKRGRPTKKQQEDDAVKRQENSGRITTPTNTVIDGSPNGLKSQSATTTDLPLVEINGSSGRKRRRLTPPEKHDGTWFEQLQIAAGKTRRNHAPAQPTPPESMARSLDEIGSPDQDDGNHDEGLSVTASLDTRLIETENPLLSNVEITPSPIKPTKTLKLNGAGGLGTPAERRSRKKKKQVVDDEAIKSPRPTRGKKQLRHTVLLLQYGQQDDELRISIGQKIDAILASPAKDVGPTKPSAPTKKSAVNPWKPSHPFFSEKPPSKSRARSTKDAEPDQAVKARPAMSFSTPGKLNAMRRAPAALSYAEDNSKPDPQKDRIYKVPGTVDPAWPPRDSYRVEPIQQHALPQTQRAMLPNRYHKNRRKARPTYIDSEESVLYLFSRSLVAAGLRTSLPPRPNLPRRAVMSGHALRKQALLAITKASPAESVCQHPLLKRLLDTISSSQSAFDRGQCEAQAWTQKYAPRTSAELLQPEKEVRVLREWLQLQTVNSTRINVLDTSVAGRPHDASLKRRKKRRKVSDELDGFIVEDGDEGKILKDLNDDEGSTSSLGSGMRSLVQDDMLSSAHSASTRKANAMLISGPIGCGKTAAVYALAKELNFEVFDIGPNTQRSGRDILNKVGNMAQYHQVSRSKESSKPEPTDMEYKIEEEDSILPTERSQDQSSLTSFFTKPKRVQSKPRHVRAVVGEKPVIKTVAKLQGKLLENTRASTRQTQSLILLEEVDILFEQDKQFWETVLELAAQSRRPIIMTCNDESLIPIDDLHLHALLRFRMPPMLISTQYLTLVAAAEGHLVDPIAVANLLESKKHDLRAAMAELSFWCQMALGDQKGGLEWYLPQWPAGADVDADGQKLRVVSEGIYTIGLGFLENMKSDEVLLEDDSQLREAWEQWSIDPTDVFFEAIEQGMPRFSSISMQPTGFRNFLTMRDREAWSDLMSAADTFCRVGLPFSDSRPGGPIIDPTLPPMSLMARADHIEGRIPLDAPELIDYQCLDAQMAVYINLETAKHFTGSTPKSNWPADMHTRPSSLRKRLLDLYNSKGSSQQQTLEQSSKSLLTILLPLADPTIGLNTRAVLSTEITPFVRSIAYFDLMLERHREDIAGPVQKPRKTRASRSALEGGQRSQTRRERWFGKDISLMSLVNTAGEAWPSSMMTSTAVNGGASRSASSREGSIDELA